MAIAVIVDGVAYFDLRDAGRLASAEPADEAGLAAVISVLVDDLVAVVVQSIALLGGGLAGDGVADGTTVWSADGVATLPAGTDAEAAFDADVETVVDVAITVVVQAVADLGAGFARRCIANCEESAGIAHPRPFGLADAFAIRAGVPDVEAFVCTAVAVVVEAVARFNGQVLGVEHRRGAWLPTLLPASLGALGADPKLPAITWALVAGGAGNLTNGRAFVGGAVAVVVRSVAVVDRGRRAGIATQSTLDARLLTSAAEALGIAGDARIADAHGFFVSATIAVVVFAITELGLRGDAPQALGPLALDTGLLASGAQPDWTRSAGLVGAIRADVGILADPEVRWPLTLFAGAFLRSAAVATAALGFAGAIDALIGVIAGLERPPDPAVANAALGSAAVATAVPIVLCFERALALFGAWAPVAPLSVGADALAGSVVATGLFVCLAVSAELRPHVGARGVGFSIGGRGGSVLRRIGFSIRGVGAAVGGGRVHSGVARGVDRLRVNGAGVGGGGAGGAGGAGDHAGSGRTALC